MSITFLFTAHRTTPLQPLSSSSHKSYTRWLNPPRRSCTTYTFPTANGTVVSTLLEELKAVYGGPDYTTVHMSIRDADIGKVHNQVKSDWFLKINPNGRIPAIAHDGFSVFETSAILLYLAQQFDEDNKFSRNPVTDPKGYSEQLQWLFFAHGGIGPMHGQAGHFVLYAPEKVPYGIDRYIAETRRLYAVVEKQLEGREFLLGTYGIVDIKIFGWTRFLERVGIPLEEIPNVKAWYERIDARPAVQAGIVIATPPAN